MPALVNRAPNPTPTGLENAMKTFRNALIFCVFSSLTAGCTIAEQERKYRIFFARTAQALVPGFRLPDESQYGPAWALVEGHAWRTRDGSGETKAEFWTSGEFNGDGTTDYAYILIEEATDTRTLIAFLSTPDGFAARHLEAGFEWGVWLRTRPAGRYRIAATENAGRDAASAAETFVAENQVIELFERDGNASNFAWNASAQSFDRYRTATE